MAKKLTMLMTVGLAAVVAMPIRAQQPVGAPAASQSPQVPEESKSLQDPAANPNDSLVAAGELMRVDTATKTIEVRTAPDTMIMFQYTDETQVKGADRIPRGLATMAGSKITVRYTHHGETNVATEIEFHDSDK